MPRPRRIAFIGFDDVTALDLVGPMDVFDAAGRISTGSANRNDRYRLEVLSMGGQPFRAVSGLRIAPDADLARVRGPFDTLVVAGGLGSRALARDAAALRRVRTLARSCRRVASVCTGAFVLAAAGLLDGKRAVTHWASCAALARAYPEVRVEPEPIFVRDEEVYTSAGVTAGMDLALALVEADLGRQVALETARYLVLFVTRPGGQTQFSAQLAGQLAEREPQRELSSFIVEHITEDLSVARLAARVALSPRQFARVFREETGQTPASFVEGARVEVARRLLESTGLPLSEVADASGFGSLPTLRRVFARRLGVPPTAYRRRFRSNAPAAPGGHPWTS